MKRPNGPWLVTYAHDRRGHAHRCRQCNRIIKAGEQVYMARIEPKKTKAIHVACGDSIAVDDLT